MTATSKLTSKNQTTVPKAVTEALGMKPADQFVYEIQADYVILRARTGRLADLAGAFAHVGIRPKKPLTKEQTREAIGKFLGEEDARIRREWQKERRAEARATAKK